MQYEVTLTRADGYLFKHGFATMQQAREFLVRAAQVLLPGELLAITEVVAA